MGPDVGVLAHVKRTWHVGEAHLAQQGCNSAAVSAMQARQCLPRPAAGACAARPAGAPGICVWQMGCDRCGHQRPARSRSRTDQPSQEQSPGGRCQLTDGVFRGTVWRQLRRQRACGKGRRQRQRDRRGRGAATARVAAATTTTASRGGVNLGGTHRWERPVFFIASAVLWESWTS